MHCACVCVCVQIVTEYVRGRLKALGGDGGDGSDAADILEQLDDISTIEDELEHLPVGAHLVGYCL